MADKGYQSIPYIFKDEDMQANFQNNFFRRPMARGRSFYLENFTALLEVFNVFEFQGWNEFLKISEEIYTGLIPVFYNTIVPSDEDNNSLRSIVGSFELQVLPLDITQITNLPNDGILCHGGERWWEELSTIKEEVEEILTEKRSMNVRDIRTSHLLVPIRAVYFVVQHIVLSSSGNTDVMTEVNQMVMFYLMSRTMINLVRLILDFILAAVNAKRRRHATVPYDIFLTKVFIRAQLPLDGHRVDNKRPTTTMKTFSI